MSGAWIAAFGALWVLVILLGLLVLGTLRRLAPLIEDAQAAVSLAATNHRHGGLPIGAEVPAFSVETLGGGILSNADLRGTTSVVLFLGHSCKSCDLLIADLEAGSVPDPGVPLVIATDDARQARDFRPAAGTNVVLEGTEVLAQIFQSDRTPHAFVLSDDGRVMASGTPNDWERLRDLLPESEEGGDRLVQIEAAARVVS